MGAVIKTIQLENFMEHSVEGDFHYFNYGGRQQKIHVCYRYLATDMDGMCYAYTVAPVREVEKWNVPFENGNCCLVGEAADDTDWRKSLVRLSNI